MFDIRVILYDLDGVLVDACDWHYYALNKALQQVAEFKISDEEHNKTFNGLPTKKKLEILKKQNKITDNDFAEIWDLKQKLTIETILEQAKEDKEKIELHKAMRAKGIIEACVTNSIRSSAELMLTKTGQLDYLKFVITNEDVKNPKPHPEGYIKAMIKLQVFPENVLIVEDSDKGFQAALFTSAKVLRVKNAKEVTLNKILEAIK